MARFHLLRCKDHARFRFLARLAFRVGIGSCHQATTLLFQQLLTHRFHQPNFSRVGDNRRNCLSADRFVIHENIEFEFRTTEFVGHVLNKLAFLERRVPTAFGAFPRLEMGFHQMNGDEISRFFSGVLFDQPNSGSLDQKKGGGDQQTHADTEKHQAFQLQPGFTQNTFDGSVRHRPFIESDLVAKVDPSNHSLFFKA